MVDELLCGFQGTLVTDSYPVYIAYAKIHDEIIPAQCRVQERKNRHNQITCSTTPQYLKNIFLKKHQ